MQARRLHDSRSGDQRYKMALGMWNGADGREARATS